MVVGTVSSDTSPDTTIRVTDLAISSTGNGGYDVICNLVPDKDYRYLEAQVIFYDSDNNLIDKRPLIWNMNEVHSNQTIKVCGKAHLSGDNSPAKAKVLFFDCAVNNEDSEAIYIEEVTM